MSYDDSVVARSAYRDGKIPIPESRFQESRQFSPVNVFCFEDGNLGH